MFLLCLFMCGHNALTVVTPFLGRGWLEYANLHLCKWKSKTTRLPNPRLHTKRAPWGSARFHEDVPPVSGSRHGTADNNSSKHRCPCCQQQHLPVDEDEEEQQSIVWRRRERSYFTRREVEESTYICASTHTHN